MARRTTARNARPAAPEGHAPASEPRSQPSPDAIAARAHEIYLARGGAPGRELDDWLQAEQELCFPGLQE